MLGLMDLPGCLCVTSEAGLGDIGAGSEFQLQFFEAAVIGSR